MTRVLVVEDNEEGAYYLETLFRAEGWTVEVARHGEEALVKARRVPPDLIVSDLLMPVMDGYTLLRHWKADARLRLVPFVVYTATYTGAEDERLARRLGADAFIVKPCEPEEFLLQLRDVRKAAPALPVASDGPGGDESLDRGYNAVLVRKLEQKMLQLEEANRILKRDEVALRTLERAISAVSQGIVIAGTAPDHPIVYVSPGFERLTGYTAAEIIQKKSWLLQGPGTDSSAISKLQGAIAQAKSCTVELLSHRKDGTAFWTNVTLSPVVGPDEVVSHFIGVLTDVSERRELEAQLRQAQKMEAVGRLAAGIAHDFNNLLSVVLGYSELILDEASPGSALDHDMREILGAGERARELTQQLLAFSRQQVLEPRYLDLGQLLRKMEKMLRRLLGEDIELSLTTAQSAGRILADPSQIEQIVMNLAVNARDAMPGGGKLTIETASLDREPEAESDPDALPPGPRAVLTVTDTGVGMDAATLERIFEPFFTTKESGKGTGLGLSTVFGIVQQSHGRVVVESKPGLGTTFTIHFPRYDGPVEEPSPEPVPASTLRGTETILLVEDQQPVRGVTRTILERHGYRVIDVQHGADALAIAERHPGSIDLLVTDVVMPRMTGPQLADRLSVLRPGTGVVFMSGSTAGHLDTRSTSNAAVHYLQKPVTPETLLRKVRAVLNEKRAAAAPVNS